jgi:CRISPR system Cascade subunit CasE
MNMSSSEVSYWLSRLQLGIPSQKRYFRYQMHNLIWEAFPGLPRGTKQPFLFSILDQDQRDSTHCLVQSKLKPDWSAIRRQETNNEIRLKGWESKQINLQIHKGDHFYYQLNTCPMKNIYIGKSKRGIKVPLYNPIGVGKWLERRAKENGFLPIHDEYFSEKILVRRKSEINSKDIMIAVCRYTAHIQVENAHIFSDSLIKGIGSKKIFGFGMPMISPAV